MAYLDGSIKQGMCMAKIDDARTELIWPGKYNDDGTLTEVPRVSLPFQVIETVNESRATRETATTKSLGLFDAYEGKEGDTFQAGWRNKIIWGDNLLVMGSLLEKFAGKIDLIYIDPPFATGADFSFSAPIGETGQEIFKEQSVIEEKAYRDTWGKGTSSYLTMMRPRIQLLRDLLRDGGALFVHCDWHVSAQLRLVLDEIFGVDSFLNEIAWHYRRWPTKAPIYQRSHDTIFWYRKGAAAYTWNQQYQELSAETLKRFGGKKVRGETTKEVLDEDSAGAPMRDVWDIPHVLGANPERVDFPTQKPIALLKTIIAGSSNPGDLVADFFVGSGTCAVAAESTGRRWIGCDLGRWAIHVTRKRLLGIEGCKPFEVLNLGKYERQYWQGVTFGDKKPQSLTEQALYEYLAFILKLYGAQPVAGMVYLHGKKGKATVHIGAVDAPVTIAEIDSAVDECTRLKQGELHVLGWEWEMGLANLMVDAAKRRGVKLVLLQIPREVMEQQASAKGDVRFFELAYLEADIKQHKNLAMKVSLKDFVIPNTELIPEEVRNKIRKWSDYIDYWAVDWDFRNDTFMQSWVAYRTRKERKLPLTSDVHAYERPGNYRLLVKVIDIFGNDTSQAFDVEVK
jgi:DNA modification methylase